LFNFGWAPYLIVSDAAESIKNAVTEVFPRARHQRYFFHVNKAFGDKLLYWKDPNEKKALKEKKPLLLYSNNLLHNCRDDKTFIDLWKLVKVEWEANYGEKIAEYFKKNFMDNRKKLSWHRSDLIGMNLTNNGLESLHKDLKQTYTEKKKLKLSDFLVVGLNLLEITLSIIKKCLPLHQSHLMKPIKKLYHC